MDIRIIVADYADKQQASDIVTLRDCHARDRMGGGAVSFHVPRRSP